MQVKTVFAQGNRFLIFVPTESKFVMCDKEQRSEFVKSEQESLHDFVEGVADHLGVRYGSKVYQKVMDFYKEFVRETVKVNLAVRKYDFEHLKRMVSDNSLTNGKELLLELLDDISQQVQKGIVV